MGKTNPGGWAYVISQCGIFKGCLPLLWNGAGNLEAAVVPAPGASVHLLFSPVQSAEPAEDFSVVVQASPAASVS